MSALRSLARELRAAGSADERVYLLERQDKALISEASWEAVKDSGITEAFLDVTVSPTLVSRVSLASNAAVVL